MACAANVGQYGALILNSVGHNAVEFEVLNGSLTGWLVLGTSTVDGDFVAWGDVGGITPAAPGAFGVMTGGGIAIGSGLAPTPNAPFLWATGKVYRIGRLGNRVKVVRVDPGNVVVQIWDGNLNNPTNIPTAKAAWYSKLDLGLLVTANGGSYSYPINCKTGTWAP